MEQKREEGKQILKGGDGGKQDQGVGALKREGAETPLRTMASFNSVIPSVPKMIKHTLCCKIFNVCLTILWTLVILGFWILYLLRYKVCFL